MNFISYEFLYFFAIVFVLYWRPAYFSSFFARHLGWLGWYWKLPTHRQQNFILLVASYIFYGRWDWRFLGLLLISSVVDFICGQLLDTSKHRNYSTGKRKFILTCSVFVNLGMLGVFKYYDFFAKSLQELITSMGGSEIHPFLLNITLPVGISFYTFQTMSYTIDVYRGKMPATNRFLDFMLYVSFFPQLVAGPIERASHLLPEILNERRFSWSMISSGCQLALVGFFKKMVIADNLALIVKDVYGASSSDGLTVLLATYAFAIQIYCDFSGYTDIARGVARMLGFELCLNFRLPYFSTTPSEFWQRWHISLSAWLRDYLYFPLGGNRGGSWMTYRNLALTMLLGGLWHGAKMHFVVWGAYQGALLILFRLFQKSTNISHLEKPRGGIFFWLKVIGYFHLTCYGWLIFRAENMEIVFRMTLELANMSNWEPIDMIVLSQVAVFTLPLIGFQIYQFYKNKMETWTEWSTGLRVLFYLALFYSIVLFGTPVKNAFIYFQF